MENLHHGHYEKIEKWPPFRKYWSFGSPVYPTSHVCVVLHFLIFVIALVQWVLQLKFKDFLELSTKRSLHSTLWNNYTTRTSNSNELFFRNCTYIWDKYIWIFLRTHLMLRIWWYLDREQAISSESASLLSESLISGPLHWTEEPTGLKFYYFEFLCFGLPLWTCKKCLRWSLRTY